MNITYVLGNGFDIQLGLNSRYSDFLKEYVQLPPLDNINVKSFKEYLSKNQNKELWSNAEKAMGDHLGNFSDGTINIYIEQILDFEGKLVEYLEKEDARCSFEKREAIRKGFLGFLQYSFNDVLNRRRDEVIEGGTEVSNTYNFVTFNYTSLLDNIIKCCVDSNKKLIERRIRTTTYTDVLGSIYHVHGTLKTGIIMGVNDENQLNTKGGILLTDRLKRKFIKPYLNQMSRLCWDTDAHNVIAKSDLIVIYGVSYGATDNLWWAELREWLKKAASHKLMVFIRDSGKTFNPKLPWDEMDYEEDKRSEVLQNLGLSASDPEFEILKNQVYLVVNTQRLNLKEIILGDEKSKETVAASNTANMGFITA